MQIASDDALASLKSAVAKSRFAAKTEIVVGDLRRVEALLDLHPMTRKRLITMNNDNRLFSLAHASAVLQRFMERRI